MLFARFFERVSGDTEWPEVADSRQPGSRRQPGLLCLANGKRGRISPIWSSSG